MRLLFGRSARFRGMADWELVERCASERSAFGELYARYYRMVFRYCLKRVSGDLAMAEDLTEEVFFRAFRSLSEVQDSARPVPAWLMVIARNVVVSYYRSPVSHRVVPVGAASSGSVEWFESVLGPSVDGVGFDDVLLRVSVGGLLRAWLAGLSEQQFDAVVLRFVEGLSVEETATKLGVSEGAVKQLTYRAMHRFRSSELFGVLQAVVGR